VTRNGQNPMFDSIARPDVAKVKQVHRHIYR
jgi:hypothetical protein